MLRVFGKCNVLTRSNKNKTTLLPRYLFTVPHSQHLSAFSLLEVCSSAERSSLCADGVQKPSAIKVNNERKEEKERPTCLTTRTNIPSPRNRSLHLPLPEVKRTNCFQTYFYGYPQSRKRSNYENYIYRPTRLISPIMVGKRHSCEAILKIKCKCTALRSRADCHHCHFLPFIPLPANRFYSVSKSISAMEPTQSPPLSHTLSHTLSADCNHTEQ